ncbi:MAG: KamA family radical SAM protein [Desulfobulbaceae bacterium]|uniref:KamA family radical SAM protein n=1 Tax=Candidatus Desulfatifera sulfidica TaxID=2841691 RepID=A0A8J6TBS3_9BACT|nr:KamA family radical SAM protein [Candidatus Desulfatifera sulfidica]
MGRLSINEPFEKLDSIDFQKLDWKVELSNNLNSLDKLSQYFPLSEEERLSMQDVLDRHPMNIPRYYLSLINADDPNDPVRKLAIPSVEELVVVGQMGETTGDPYGDDKHNKGNGILHKYPYSALVVATEYCSMYCRHCFRKRLVGLPGDKTVDNFQNAAKYIARHKEITNVIISGGDPMMLPTKVIAKMLEALKNIDHVNYVRIGTRTPVVYPLRYFDDELIEVLRDFNRHKTLYVPTHFNHANEITDISREAVRRIRSAGITVNNQTVFLKGVNDTVADLEDLMNGLVRIGVNPYYLYQCMPVARVRHHFQVPLKRGVDIVSEAKRRLDGYAKRFKFIMGHDIGKIEICGRKDDILVMSQIHSRPEHPEEASRILMGRLTENAGWLEDLDLMH